MSRQDMVENVCKHARKLVEAKGYVSPLDLLVSMERITIKHIEDWRFKRIPYLERVTVGGLGKMNTILQVLNEYARGEGLKPCIMCGLPKHQQRMEGNNEPQ